MEPHPGVRRTEARLVDRGGGAQFRESRTGVFSLAAHPPAAVRGVAAWVAAADGPPKRAAAAALLTDGALVVAAARLAHFLQIAPKIEGACAAVPPLNTLLCDVSVVWCLYLGKSVASNVTILPERLSDASTGCRFQINA